MEKKQYRVTFISDEAFVSELRSFANTNQDKIEIESERTTDDPVRLGFELATAATIVTLVAGTFYFIELGVKVSEWLRKSNANKIIIKTPFKTMELSKSSNVTEAEVIALLKDAYSPPE